MLESNQHTAGWDIGGAHIKLAFVQANELCVRQWSCPLWQGIEELEKALSIAAEEIPDSINFHNVTMTGEMVDIFASHEEGVISIINAFVNFNGNKEYCRFYSSNGLLTFEQAMGNLASVASANWIASAESVSQKIKNVIFVDVGSTTTDILQIDNSGLVLQAKTDFERLITGELVYTGVVRSCVNTICQQIPYKGKWVPLMAELFSTSADVYRILEWLPVHADYGSTMDGGEKDKISSMRRLARMIGKDYVSSDEAMWIEASEYIAGQQMHMIEKTILSMLQANQQIKTIVGAGVGAFLSKIIAERLSIEYIDYANCVVPSNINYKRSISDCAPAVALTMINKE